MDKQEALEIAQTLDNIESELLNHLAKKAPLPVANFISNYLVGNLLHFANGELHDFSGCVDLTHDPSYYTNIVDQPEIAGSAIKSGAYGAPFQFLDGVNWTSGVLVGYDFYSGLFIYNDGCGGGSLTSGKCRARKGDDIPDHWLKG